MKLLTSNLMHHMAPKLLERLQKKEQLKGFSFSYQLLITFQRNEMVTVFIVLSHNIQYRPVASRILRGKNGHDFFRLSTFLRKNDGFTRRFS